MLVQSKRDKVAALRLVHKLLYLNELGFAPKVLATDKLRSYGAAHRSLGLWVRNDQGGRENNRAKKLTSARATTGTKAVQVIGIRPTLRLPSCRRLHHVQPSAPPDLSSHVGVLAS
jgi:transposase-like protein